MKLNVQSEARSGEVHLNVDELVLEEDLQKCLIGCFTRRFPGKQAVFSLTKAWKVQHRVEFRSSDWVIFRFQSVSDLEQDLSSGSYFIYGRILILKRIPLFF